MLRSGDHLFGRPEFHQSTGVHDCNTIPDGPSERQIVCDEEQGHPVSLSEIEEEADDACPDRDIEHGDWFVGDQQLWFENGGRGNAYSLALTAGQLMRVSPRVVRAGRQTTFLKALGECRA